jgi:DNA-binding MarR family transcriptional regulator
MGEEASDQTASAGQGAHAAKVGALLQEYGQLSRRLVRRHMKALGLTAAESRTMIYISVNAGIVQGRLAELMDVQPIVLTRVVDALEAGGIAERRTSEADRRVRKLYLTRRGSALVRQVRAFNDCLDQEITSRLSPEALESLASTLLQVNRRFREMT